MKYKVLEILQNNSDFVSGQQISEILHVTRSSVWKNINSLKQEGYNIQGISNKGYKLISSPDIMIPNQINKYINTKYIGKTIKYYKSLKSTNVTAKELAATLENGSIIISEIQEGGTGRFGRHWVSPAGGIWFSIILKPNLEPQYASKITIIAACALVKALEKIGLTPKIKWPNDIYINSKKLCGILTEMKCEMDTINYLIVGIGINANLTKNNFEQDVRDIVTSIQIEKNEPINRNELLGIFLTYFEELYTPYISNLDLKETAKISKEYSMIIDKTAYYVTMRGKEKVKCIGITDDLELIIQDSNGNVKTVLSGEITFKK